MIKAIIFDFGRVISAQKPPSRWNTIDARGRIDIEIQIVPWLEPTTVICLQIKFEI